MSEFAQLTASWLWARAAVGPSVRPNPISRRSGRIRLDLLGSCWIRLACGKTSWETCSCLRERSRNQKVASRTLWEANLFLALTPRGDRILFVICNPSAAKPPFWNGLFRCRGVAKYEKRIPTLARALKKCASHAGRERFFCGLRHLCSENTKSKTKFLVERCRKNAKFRFPR